MGPVEEAFHRSFYYRGATASGRSRDVRARKAARAWKLQGRTRAQINQRVGENNNTRSR